MRKIYASPGGTTNRYMHEIRYSVKIPASGVLKGRLLAKKEEKGSIPSRPSSWKTRPWENWLADMLPRVDSAMKKLRAYGVYGINKRGGNM